LSTILITSVLYYWAARGGTFSLYALALSSKLDARRKCRSDKCRLPADKIMAMTLLGPIVVNVPFLQLLKAPGGLPFTLNVSILGSRHGLFRALGFPRPIQKPRCSRD
jgi:hypothetical protein